MKKDKKINKELVSETDKIGEIAIQYGFSIINTPTITPDVYKKSKQFKEYELYNDIEEKISLLNWYDQNNLYSEQQPIMIHYKKPFPGSGQRKKPNENIYGLEIMGSNKNTSEALCIKTALSMLYDLGHKDVYIDINSIGDKESVSKFEKELNSYFRKNLPNLPTKIKSEGKKNIYSIAREMGPMPEGLPQSIAYLSDFSKNYFKETLEYLEAFEIPYKIKSQLVGNKLYSSHTIFEIRDFDSKKDKEGTLLAYGYRYNSLAKKIGLKKELSCIGCTLIIKSKKAPKKILVKNIKKPSFYLVQLGNTAKLKALNIVEILRRNKIPVYHSLTKDKITGQLTGAEYNHASHVLIVGQKEAIDNTVVVRNITTREQETVDIKDLPAFLTKLEKTTK